MNATKSRAPDCQVCGVPLSGALGSLLSMAGIGRSPRNPNCCTRCNGHIEEGRLVEITMLFADLSGFTAMTNAVGAERAYGIVDSYLRKSAEILTGHGAFIDKFIGDSVMAFFNAPVKRPDHPEAAVAAARALLAALPEVSKDLDRCLCARIGIATGYARVGRLGSDDAKDYTAIGEVVNQAARLQAHARPGEILVSAAVYDRIEASFPGVPAESLTLKGFQEPVLAHRLDSKEGPVGEFMAPVPRAKRLGAVSVLAAFFGAGCLGKLTAGSLGLFLGGGFSSAVFAWARWIDRSPLRFPLLAAAVAAALWGLYSAAAEKKERSRLQALNACVALAPGERRLYWTSLFASALTLVFVVFELAVHYRFL